MSGILVITEQNGLAWHRMSFETLAAGQKLAAALGVPLRGVRLRPAAWNRWPMSWRNYRVDGALAVEDDLLDAYTADGMTDALAWLVDRVQPACVLLPHTYQGRDLAPKLATRCGCALLSDVTGFTVAGGEVTYTRQLFQGKLNAEYTPMGEGIAFVSLQAGAFPASLLESGSAAVEVLRPGLDAARIRQRPEARFREEARCVDLGAAERIVAVGRGIQEEANLDLARELAEALGAEMAASRPICDNGWMEMGRQVGSSGQTVEPTAVCGAGHLRGDSTPGGHARVQMRGGHQ